jgi:nucleoid DNA-binding protein
MKIHLEDILEEVRRRKPEYSHLSDKELKEIGSTPFLSIRRDIEKGDIQVYRLEGFGTFYMSIKRAKVGLVSLRKAFDNNKISYKEFKRIEEIYEKYLKRKDV